MSPGARLAKWRYLEVAVLVAVVALAAVAVLLAYDRSRTVTLDVGNLGDGAFVSGFYADEPDIDYRYRWTNGHAEVEFLGAGSAKPQSVLVVAQPLPSSLVTQPFTISVSLDGTLLQPPEQSMQQPLSPYTYTVAPETAPAAGSPRIAIDSTAVRPPGDARLLGVKVDRVQLAQLGIGSNLPPMWVLLWSLLLVAGLFGVLLFIEGPGGSVARLVVGTLVAVLLFALFTANVMYTAAYMPPVAVVAGAAGLLVWQRRRLQLWPNVVDALARPNARLATLVFLVASVVMAAVALWAIPQVEWIGHADYAENANVARSLVEGRGFTVDYVAQFYKDYPGITHPAETWPLLQPLLISPFFALFGPTTWAAKLPNLFVWLALAWAVFYVATRVWDARVGLLAGLLTLLHPYFFNSVLYPINDLVFTFLFFVLAWLVWRGVSPLAQPETDTGSGQTLVSGPAWWRNTLVRAVATGVVAGLLIWSKPSGATLLAGLALWAGWTWLRSGGRRATLPWRGLAAASAGFAVILLPLVGRNLLDFGTLFFSTESLDAWILRYWPYHDWEDIYKVYVGAEDYPHPRWIVGGKFGYQNLVDAIAINFRWLWLRGVMSGPDGSDYILGPLPLAGALIGLCTLGRRAANLFGMVGLSLLMYALFVLLYWHFEGRYFQVVIPWLYMLLAWGLIRVWDSVRAALGATAGRRLGLLLLPVGVLALLWPSITAISDFTVYDTRPTSFTVAMGWLSKNSTASDVVMTRDPWELNWYTRRKAVMIPNDDFATIQRIARQYGVTMLQLGGPSERVDIEACPPDDGRPESAYPTGQRPALGRLYCGYERPGMELVYQNNDLTIYRVSP
jgi:hypothetical protein